MNTLKYWLVCIMWNGGRHDWRWIHSINEKNPSHYRCARCHRVG